MNEETALTIRDIADMHLREINRLAHALSRPRFAKASVQQGPKPASTSTERVVTYLPSERYHMMLAQTEHLNVLHDNQLIMVLMENSPVDQIPHVLFITLGEEEHSLCIS